MPDPSEILGRETPVVTFRHRQGGRFRVLLRGQRLVVGRGSDCDVQLPDEERLLSRHHLVLQRRGRGVVLQDRSTHGTWLDGERVDGQSVPLLCGACVRLGAWTLTLDAGAGHPQEDATQPCPAAGEPRCLGLPGVVGRSRPMMELGALVERLARFDVPVLVCGETGTGKELVAQALHSLSARARRPLIPLNCGAIHDGTAASELFGHVRGAFTGADARKAGVFERAAGGTVFLDEVGELPLQQQAALLRVLEVREVLPLGAQAAVPVDFRLVVATNRDLASDVVAGAFREDLYYRMAVACVRVPALRERIDDIPLLADHFLLEAQGGESPGFRDDALRRLQEHAWPGNVRELRNVIQRALVACDGASITPQMLQIGPARVPRATGLVAADAGAFPTALERQRHEIEEVLRRCGGNRSQAAEHLGISRSTFYERLQRTGLGAASAEPAGRPGFGRVPSPGDGSRRA